MYFYDVSKLHNEEVFIYLRKSRSDDPSLTVEEVLEKHEMRLQEWAEKNINGRISESNILREVVSGETIADRPRMQELLAKIESHKIKAVLVVEPQRLSRGDLEDAGRIIKMFRYSNTIIITPARIYDLRDEYDRENFERELKEGNRFLEYQKKIMNNGRLHSVAQGNYIGSVAPYGYEKIQIKEGKKKCHTLKINETEAEAVRLAFDMYVNQDMGGVNIANRLNELGFKPRKAAKWEQATIKDMLENYHYIGKVVWNFRKTIKIIEEGEVKTIRPKNVDEFLMYDGKHEAIIPLDLWEAAQAKRGRNHRAKPKTKVRNPLAGLLFCRCGRAMSLRTYKTNGVERSPARLICDDQPHCNTGSVLYEEMLDKVVKVLEECIEDFEIRLINNNEDSVKLHLKLIKRLEAKLVELEKLELAQWEKYTNEDMPRHIFEKLNEKVLTEKDEIQEALCKAKEAIPDPIDYEERIGRFSDALAALRDPEVDALKKNNLLKACIDRIDYSREKPVRIRSTAKRVTVNGRRIRPDGLPTGGNWTSPPIEMNVSLRL